jgi:hypothetical protein
MASSRRLATSLCVLCVLFLFGAGCRTSVGDGTAAFFQGPVSTPEEFLGFEVGADYHLATYEEALGYWERLASQTKRMQLFDMGTTAMGRRMKYAVISSEANMARLDEYKDISRKISLTRGVDEEAAAALAQKGKTVVWIDGGLHASECANAQQMIQLAYDLVTGEDAETKRIRENVIALLVFPNPDGMTMLAEWYRPNVGSPYEVSPMPWVYNKYAGHDNNRDAFYANLQETRNLMRVQYHEWFPTVLLNHHQTAPFPARIWIPPFAEPTNADIHPLIWRAQNLIGAAMGMAFDAAGQPGAISRIAFDGYYPGYMTAITDGHNCPSILTEIALYRYATPRFYSVEDFPPAYKDLTPGRFYPTPWKGGWWRLSDAVEYGLTASKAVLDVSARYREELLTNKYKMGQDAIRDGIENKPHGWIISPEQHDTGAPADMLSKLILLGAEVYQAEESFAQGGVEYPGGTYFVPASQAFGPFVKEMFQRQTYPDLRQYPHLWQNMVGTPLKGEEPLRPYDAAGWTLPIQFGVSYVEMAEPPKMAAKIVTEVPAPSGSLEGSGPSMLFGNHDNASFRAVNSILAAGGRVSRMLEEATVGGRRYKKGAFVADAGSLSLEKLKEIALQTGISMASAPDVPAKTEALKPWRLGLYRSWVASMDEGWMRLIFDEGGFPHKSLTNADIKAGRLREAFDVIVLPDQSPEAIVNGHASGTMPPDYTGGITEEGVVNLRRFVEAGGTLICNNSSGMLAIERFDLPVKNILRGVTPKEFYIAGSIVKMDYDTGHPLAFGMPEMGVAFFSRAMVFEAGGRAEVVARYPKDSLLLSGWSHGEEKIQGQASVVDVPLGKGRVILFGFNVVNRWQTPASLKLLFNAIHYGVARTDSPAGT